jgi:hypothetical protein
MSGRRGFAVSLWFLVEEVSPMEAATQLHCHNDGCNKILVSAFYEKFMAQIFSP